VAFKPNYGRDRAERARAARARNEEKQRKKEEKSAGRKTQRTEVGPPTDETAPPSEEKQCTPGADPAVAAAGPRGHDEASESQ
jgi:hypothetical protein